ncbi:LysR family transcriptional regulator [Pyruvatibacter mobilis]|uniref:LysR family transcriptional regulator n=1 Tax=Pyruvatibacter mobilis TaxID=1712261 RepID=UPI003BAB9338
MDTLEAMRVFAAVAEEGSFSGAARRLGMSKALASKKVGQLEEQLGVRLLNRTTRHVGLTEIGAAYRERCAALVAEVDEAHDMVRSRHGAPRGVLRVAAPRAFGEDVLTPALASFLARYPDITVEITLDERRVDIIGEGYDVAVRVDDMPDSSLIIRKITDFPYKICASPAYLEKAGYPQYPDDLASHTCIVLPAISPTAQWQFRVEGEVKRVTVPSRVRINTARGVATLVRQGMGIGLCLWSSIREDLEAGRVVEVLAEYNGYERAIYAAYPHSRHLSGKVRAFVEHLIEHCREGAA